MMSAANFYGRRTVAVYAVVLFVTSCSAAMSFSPRIGNGETTLINGGFEDLSGEAQPTGWFVPPAISESGYQLRIRNDAPFEGNSYAVLSSTGQIPSNQAFGNVVQTIEAASWAGKRVRFSAAVRTADLEAASSGRLWLRIDGEPNSGIPSMLAFDKMERRPIRSQEWTRYEIVADVPENARVILVGVLLIGTGEVSVDDAIFEETDRSIPTTTDGRFLGETATSGRSDGPDPSQPFWSSWLLAAVVAVSLVVLSYIRDCWLQRFGFRFTLAYFLLYSFPQPFSQILPPVSFIYDLVVGKFIDFTASIVFSIDLPPLRPTGSGDTLRDYIRVFLCFSAALISASVWSLGARWFRIPDWLLNILRSVLRDGLRTYVRWVLAVTMLSYGLAKLGTLTNQFPEPGVGQLLKTWGDSSPMNVVWTFMGASREYTNFSGWLEVLAASLLIWRRTATLGGLVAAGIMSNVFMLNMCYDVPVKQYSAHLLLMSVFVILHDWNALFHLLIRNRPITPTPVGPCYPEPVLLWFHRGFKSLAVLLFMVFPVVSHFRLESSVAGDRASNSPFLGDYVVESGRSPGNEPWKYLSIQAFRSSMIDTNPKTVAVIRTSEGSVTSAAVTLNEAEQKIGLSVGATPIEFAVEMSNQQKMTWKSDSSELVLKRIHRDDFLLVNRGFRWISEYPYNR